MHAIQEEPMPMADEPIPWKEVQLYPEHLENLTRIASDLSPELKEELIQCLTHNRDVFAWSVSKLPGCLFGVKGGKFLGYLVTVRGIEVNPEKVQALRDMKAPQNLKEAQKLWDEECTRAFEELKKYLETLPSLFKPITGEPLWIYLSATPEVMGVVLVKEQDNVQRSLYFFSHLLKGVESRYTALEKFVYGLVLMARRLRSYFLAYPITVLTNSTMGKALTNVEVAGQLIKWVTELGEYNIVYQPRTIAVRLNFRATNKEAEYETLLVGLQATRHVGAARVIIYSDFQLVTQQVAGNFEVNSDKLQVYREAYEKMKEEFKEVTVSKIPRTENSRADELAKMASSLTTWVLDKSIVETFLIAQIDLQNNVEELINWRAPMISYLQQGILPTDLKETRLVRKKVHAYSMIGDQLYKRAFSRPFLKCLSMEEAEHALQEIHRGCCGSHAGGRTLARRVLLAGYF
ncbi:uncharacterized protein LOC121978198 [Zingiber officinale]|uniref:uncharacterized protein LOC121978198 n=1 Tax=Zingiber officinale TaxID=94328 RepID=UPI001C4C86FB|nr:uncharacterized protein LOC121978198 [Zingiber officinale]